MRKPMLAALILAANLSWANLHMVEPGASIQSAVNLAAAGDTILILDGTYTETVVTYGKDLTIGSSYLLDGDLSHVDATVIYPDDARPDTGSCFVYGYGEANSRLSGLVIRSGYGTVLSIPNEARRCGGGVLAYNSHLQLDHCRVQSCAAWGGGGVGAYSYPADGNAGLDISACTISQCWADEWGGAIGAFGATLTVGNCLLTESGAGLGGGAIAAERAAFHMTSCTVDGNLGYYAGALFLIEVVPARLENCHFIHNISTGSGNPSELQALQYEGCITRCLFESSSINSGSSAILLWEDGDNSRTDFLGNTIQGYDAVLGSGQVLIYQYASGDIAYNVFRNNRNNSGSPLYIFGEQSNARVHHNLFLNNTTVMNEECGSAVSTVYDAAATIDSNWFEGNIGNAVGTLPYNCSPPFELHLEDNWWGSATGPYHATLNPSGQGDSLCVTSAAFSPWLSVPPDTAPPIQATTEPRPMVLSWQLQEMYPNPFNSSITLVLAGFAGSDFDISLYNLLGQQVDAVHRGALTGGQLVYQAPPWLASGVYLLSAKDKHAVQTKKVVLLK